MTVPEISYTLNVVLGVLTVIPTVCAPEAEMNFSERTFNMAIAAVLIGIGGTGFYLGGG